MNLARPNEKKIPAVSYKKRRVQQETNIKLLLNAKRLERASRVR